VINFQALVDQGTVNAAYLYLIRRADTANEVFELITTVLIATALARPGAFCSLGIE
jgi:hypothetical protein